MSLKPMLMLSFVIFAGAALPLGAAADDGQSTVAIEVRDTLQQQIADWNRGDIDAFMRSYWKDPNVRFASGGDIKRGWAPVLEQYKLRYPDKSAMGKLTTAELDVTALSTDSALAFGRWIVTAEGQDVCGLFSLVWRRIDGSWVIVHDHTSSGAETTSDGRSCTDIKNAASAS